MRQTRRQETTTLESSKKKYQNKAREQDIEDHI